MVRNYTSPTISVFQYCLFFMWALCLTTFRDRRRKYDLVYVHNMPNFLVFAALIPKLRGAKVLVDVHDPVPELLATVRRSHTPGWLLWLARAEERVSLSFSDAVITVNESMRQRLVHAVPAQTHMSVVMNLPDPKIFTPVNPSHETSSNPFLVYSGTIARRHGLDLAVRALALVADEFPNLHIRLIGMGPSVTSVSALAERLGVAKRVEFLEEVRLEEIPALVTGAVGGLSPHREDAFGSLVFSVKVAEYISLGIPVICSRIGAMRHYFCEDELFFFNPDDVNDLARAIRELLSDPIAAEQRSIRSQQKLRQLDWSMQRGVLVRTVECLVAKS
jgi:glycosyltransferase involved in cell wall biosynthesis